MAYSLKENLMKEDRLSGGHRMCAGCGSPIAVRTVLRALNPEDKAVVCSATSCLEVSTFMYPYTAWKDSFIHNAFENAAATIDRNGEIPHHALNCGLNHNDLFVYNIRH